MIEGWMRFLVFRGRTPFAGRGVRVGAAIGFLSVLIGFSGCGPRNTEYCPGSSSASGSFQYDSAGVLISETRGSDSRAAIGWRIDSVPDLFLGAGDPQAGFFRVQGVRGFPGGGILVMDGGSRKLRFFDTEGQMLDWVGRRGRGPGEFEDPVLVHVIGTDSHLLWDKRLP